MTAHISHLTVIECQNGWLDFRVESIELSINPIKVSNRSFSSFANDSTYLILRLIPVSGLFVPSPPPPDVA